MNGYARTVGAGAALCVGTAVLVGCSTEGALGQIEATADCPPSDFACLSAGLSAPVAVGASTRIRVQLESMGTAAPMLVFDSADEAVLSVQDDQVTGQAPGMSALLIRTEAGVVIDFVHLWVAEPTRLGIQRHDVGWEPNEELTGPVQLLAGDELLLSAAPYRNDDWLLGQIDLDWTVQGEAVTMLTEGYPSFRRVVARQEGNATLQVSAGDLTAELSMEVLP